MATVASGLNSGSGFNSSDTITSTTLNNHVNNATVTNIVTDDIAASSSKTTGVTFAKMQHISTEKLVGRTSSNEGDIEEIDIAGASGILLDEDTLSSDSATRGATQQSIKAYVDSVRPNIVGANSTTTGNNSTNQDWFDFPGLEVTITPRLTGSNFMINANAMIGNERSEMVWGKIVYKVNSGSYADVAVAPSLGSNRRSIMGSSDMDYDNGNWMSSLALNIFGTGLSYSAGDTLTFKVQLQNSSTTANSTFFNVTQNDTDNVYIPRGVSTIIVQEI